jgi:hypothetical protein
MVQVGRRKTGIHPWASNRRGPVPRYQIFFQIPWRCRLLLYVDETRGEKESMVGLINQKYPMYQPKKREANKTNNNRRQRLERKITTLR